MFSGIGILLVLVLMLVIASVVRLLFVSRTRAFIVIKRMMVVLLIIGLVVIGAWVNNLPVMQEQKMIDNLSSQNHNISYTAFYWLIQNDSARAFDLA